MAARKKRRPPPPAAPPTIHEATLASGPSGAVLKGAEIDMAAAIARPQASLDIVVCGDDRKANRAVAQRIEAAVGPYESQDPHKRAGPHALPHFQPEPRPPDGHSFYETDNPAQGEEATMKYFTPELLNRVRSADEDVADAAHDDWELAIKRLQPALRDQVIGSRYRAPLR